MKISQVEERFHKTREPSFTLRCRTRLHTATLGPFSARLTCNAKNRRYVSEVITLYNLASLIISIRGSGGGGREGGRRRSSGSDDD